MGKSPTIKQMEQKEDEYRNYLQKIENDLEERSKNYSNEMQKKINDYYKDNNYEKNDFISGKSSDFMHKSEWSMKNVKAIIDAIAKAVFGDKKDAPEGVTIKDSEEVGKAIANMENLEVYIMGKCFEVLSGVIESFGSSTSVSFNSSYKAEPIGNGMHLFVTVVCDSYKSKEFFKNEEIYQYLYLYEVKFSVDEADKETDIMETKRYEDQIATFEDKIEGLLDKLENDKIKIDEYAELKKAFEQQIDDSKMKLEKLKSADAA